MDKRKKLIILSFFIIIIMIVLVMFITRVNNKSDSDNAIKPNNKEVLNQGESILKYGDEVFLLDELSNSIVRYNTKDSSSNVIIDYETDIGKQLHIVSNQLLHFVNGNTYYLDLLGRQIKKFSNGEVVYINDEIYLYIVQKSGMDYLYITSYDNTTFRVTGEISFNLAKGYEIDFLKKTNNSIFFTSRNSDESITLFEVDLNNYKTVVVTRQTPIGNDVNGKVTFCDVVKTKEDYFYIIDNITKTTYSESIDNSYVWRRPIDSSFEEIYREIKGRCLLINSEKNSEMIYEDFNSESKTYELVNNEDSEIKYDWQEYLYGEVTRYFAFENLSVLINGEKFINMDSEYLNYSIDKVVRTKDGYYILFANEISHEWFLANEDGSSITKISSFND